ncbi:MAG TPA: hypothetical protein VHX38_02915 [Pseudonocardiaceae bacterium]|nr:hypothetical protein [Pseudonocardiaceae bacterium]
MTTSISDEQVVQACREWAEEPHTGSLDRLQHITGQSEEACAAAMHATREHGLIEWGIGMDTAWPTPAGEHLFGPSHDTAT